MGLPTIVCAACGVQTTVPRKWSSVRKYCNLCQIARDCAIKLPAPRDCARCGDTFFPIRASKTWDKCSNCASFHSLEKLRERGVECNTCHELALPAEGLESTCLHCVQQYEEYRDGYIRKVQEIVMQRIKNHSNSVLQ